MYVLKFVIRVYLFVLLLTHGSFTMLGREAILVVNKSFLLQS